MDERQQNILKELVKSRVIKEEKLLKDFELTSRQLAYSIDMINENLKDNNLPSIEKKNGYFYAKDIAVNYLTSEKSAKNIVYTQENRIDLIIILILTRSEELSLDHFSYELQVSKNTILSDLKKAKTEILQFDLMIEFSRKEGYRVFGKEWNKRLQLLQSISTIYNTYGANVTETILEPAMIYFEQVKNEIVVIEKYLEVKYTDETFYPLIYFMSAVFIRIERGEIVNIDDVVGLEEIEQTKEFQSISFLTNIFSTLPKSEKLFFTLQLLSSKVQNKRLITEQDLPALATSLWEFLSEFESNTMLILTDKKNLLNKLINHFKPAYYRIKYHLPTENPLYEKIVLEYKVLHDFVKQSISPLEEFFQEEIADDEIAYITLFIGGHLIEEDDNEIETKIIKCAILCPNGITMSKLLEKTLKELFPEFLFYPASSVREYTKFVLPHDIVFSTVPVKSSKKVYVINEILNSTDQLNLRQHVIKDVFYLDFDTINTIEIVAVIKKYLPLENKIEKQVIDELNHLLIAEPINEESDKMTMLNPGINQIISEDSIQIINEKISWEEALLLSSKELVEKNIVDKDYQEMLIEEFKEKPEYIILRQKLLLPHLDPTKVSQKLGVNFLILNEGMKYNNQEIHLVILLTTPDKVAHLNVLYDLNKLAKDTEFIEKIVKENNSIQIYEELKAYFK